MSKPDDTVKSMSEITRSVRQMINNPNVSWNELDDIHTQLSQLITQTNYHLTRLQLQRQGVW